MAGSGLRPGGRGRGREAGRVQELTDPVEWLAGVARGKAAKLVVDTEARPEKDLAVANERVEPVQGPRGRSADPETPRKSYTPPWHGQMKVSDVGTQRTGHPTCTQREEIATTRSYRSFTLPSMAGLCLRT